MVSVESSRILYTRDLQLTRDAQPIQLSIHSGEIVGLAGLDGQGQEQFLEALAGLHSPAAGHIHLMTVGGDSIEIKSLHGAARAGVAYLPRNRKTEGIFAPLSVLDNFSVATLDRGSRFGFINRRAQKARLDYYRQKLSMVFSSPSAPITSLSGGNQQKVLLARWLAAEPRLLLLNDPTRGVDLSTRLKLYEVLRELVDSQGTTLVLLSSEIEELLLMCQRVVVFRDQSVFTTLEGEAMTMPAIIAGMFGRTDG